MKNLFIHLPLIALTILFSWNCSKDNNPLISEENFSGNLELKTEKSQYNLEEISIENYVFIKATLTNTSSDTFYTKLGDGYNASIDQEDLFIAKYTDGYFEKNISNNNWENLDLGLLAEGSRIIRILPSQKYSLRALALLDQNIEGKLRLKVFFYKSFSETEIDTLKDISNIFYISNN